MSAGSKHYDRLVLFICLSSLCVRKVAVEGMEHDSAKPAGGVAEQTDPQPWLGVWESTGRSEHFGDFLAGIGQKSNDSSKDDNPSKTYHTYRKEGSYYYDEINIPGTYNESIKFRLGEVGYSTKWKTQMKHMFYEKNQELHCDVELPEKGISYHDWSKVENGQLVKTYEVGNVAAKRWYDRVSSADSQKH